MLTPGFLPRGSGPWMKNWGDCYLGITRTSEFGIFNGKSDTSQIMASNLAGEDYPSAWWTLNQQIHAPSQVVGGAHTLSLCEKGGSPGFLGCFIPPRLRGKPASSGANPPLPPRSREEKSPFSGHSRRCSALGMPESGGETLDPWCNPWLVWIDPWFGRLFFGRYHGEPQLLLKLPNSKPPGRRGS